MPSTPSLILSSAKAKPLRDAACGGSSGQASRVSKDVYRRCNRVAYAATEVPVGQETPVPPSPQ